MGIQLNGTSGTDTISAIDGTLTVDGIITATDKISVGAAVTSNVSGINVTGIVTATSFSGSAANLTGLTAGQIPNFAASKITSGTVATARLGSGTANNSVFLRGDQSWQAVTSTTINNQADNRLITCTGTADTLNAEDALFFSSGNLSIGTASPWAQFHIHSPSGGAGTVFHAGGGVAYAIFSNASGTSGDKVMELRHLTSGGNRIAIGKNADNYGGFTEKLAFGSAGQIGIAGANYGSSGQVLTSGGASATATWTTISGGAALTGSTNNQITTVTGANAIQGEANLTFDGSTLTHKATNDLHYMMESGTAGYCRIAMGDSDDDNIGQILYNNANNKWDIRGNAAVRVEIESDGDVKLNTGNLIIGTAGKGIDFSATADGSGTDASSLFDDYEEGTFTGTWTAYTTAATTTATSANYYTKIGQQVTCYINLSNATIAGGGGAIKMEGLPYATSSDSHGGQTSTYPLLYKVDFNTNQNYHHLFYTWGSVSFIIGYYSRPNLTWQPWDVSDFHGGNVYAQFSFTYRAAT